MYTNRFLTLCTLVRIDHLTAEGTTSFVINFVHLLYGQEFAPKREKGERLFGFIHSNLESLKPENYQKPILQQAVLVALPDTTPDCHIQNNENSFGLK